MTKNAQIWLNKRYPINKRKGIETLDISDKKLEGSLTLDGFADLKKINCSNNYLTEINLSGCDPEKLVELILTNNSLEKQDLNCFSNFIKLKRLYFDNSDRERIVNGHYNYFHGSLEPLSDLRELKELSISNNIGLNGDLENLPDTLEKLYCTNFFPEKIEDEMNGCKKIIKELSPYLVSKSFGNDYYDFHSWKNRQKARNNQMALVLADHVRKDSNLTNQIGTLKVKKWLDENYPKDERRRVIQIDESDLGKEILEGFLDLTEFKSLTALNCSKQKISGLKIASVSSIEKLYCNDNIIESLDIDNCKLLEKLDCSRNKLISLVLYHCPSITGIDCSDNLLTSLKLKHLGNQNNLTVINLNDNKISMADLSIFSPFVNLKIILIGSSEGKAEKIRKGHFNNFRGSLKHLKDLNKLKILDISATNIDSGLEYLSSSLESFYCTAYETGVKVKKIEGILREYDNESISSSITEEQNKSFDYIDNLRKWKIEREKNIKSDSFYSSNNNNDINKVEKTIKVRLSIIDEPDIPTLNRNNRRNNPMDHQQQKGKLEREIKGKEEELFMKKEKFSFYIKNGNGDIEKVEKEIKNLRKEITKLEERLEMIAQIEQREF